MRSEGTQKTGLRTRSGFPAAYAFALLSCSVSLSAAEPPARPSPLDRLQNRSAASRWDEARTAWSREQAPDARTLSEESAPPSPAPGMLPVVADQASAFGSPAADETAPAAPDERRTPRTPQVDPFAFAATQDAPAAPITRTTAFPAAGGLRPATSAIYSPASAALSAALQVPPAPPSGDDPLTRPATPSGIQFPSSEGLDFRPISAIQPFYDYAPDGDDPCRYLCPLPAGCPEDPNEICPDGGPIPVTGSTDRYFPHLEFYWAASNVYHNPLYFENPLLERYGHAHFNDCVEPAFSMARFGVQLVSLPYQMALDPAWRRQYDLGWYRPGDFAPKLIYQPPLNARAAATAAGVYTGIFLGLP